ncbi:helix-turn-helix transcriptional regulator [Frigidibacter sp. MR17.14]|uniref:helix-turn-helix transcriptional regulator n=1 Tax=Frigidibacter sp. MR17.14 TaxID=3126509 RepID=UPI003012CEE7
MDGLSRQDYARLSTLAYAAALDGALWPALLQAMTGVIEGLRAHLILRVPGQAEPVSTLVAGYDPAFIRSYGSAYGRQNPWTPAAMAAPVGRVLADDELCPADRLRRTAFHADWLAPQGLSGVAGLTIASGQHSWCFLGGNLETRRHAADLPRLRRMLDTLAPHLSQAVEVGRRLETAAIPGAATPGTAAALLTPDRRAVWVNPQAAAWLEGGQWLRQGPDGRLQTADALGAALLRRFCAETGGRSGTAARAQGLALADGCVLRLARLVPADLPERPGPILPRLTTPMVLLTLTADSAAPGPDGIARLAADYGLTAAEAAVALALVGGASLREISDRRETSLHTVRNQLKSVLAKTDCRRQADLLRLLSRQG